MSVFRRRRAERADDEESSVELTEDAAASDAGATDPAQPDASDDSGKRKARSATASDDAGSADTDDAAETGPFDVDEAPEDGLERLDLGSLKIPALPGVEVQIQASEQGEVSSVALIAGKNAVQVGAFAAPRTEGIWDEVRAELLTGLKSDGATVSEADGEHGTELRGRVKTPDGPQDIRFIGFDGPRWFLRAVFHGAAATTPSAAPELTECLLRIIIDRGREAMPVREPLPLQLPAEAVAQQQAAAEEAADGQPPNGVADQQGSDRR